MWFGHGGDDGVFGVRGRMWFGHGGEFAEGEFQGQEARCWRHEEERGYWYFFTIAWPNWRGFRLEDRIETIDDGTTVTTIARVPL
jgi:hypothetical protein